VTCDDDDWFGGEGVLLRRIPEHPMAMKSSVNMFIFKYLNDK